MPGYVLVRMELSDKTYHLVNSINRVTGFLGAGQADADARRRSERDPASQRRGRGRSGARNLIRFDVGEKVNVTDGPFEGFSGMVEEVDEAAAASRSPSRSLAGRRRSSWNSRRSPRPRDPSREARAQGRAPHRCRPAAQSRAGA